MRLLTCDKSCELDFQAPATGILAAVQAFGFVANLENASDLLNGFFTTKT